MASCIIFCISEFRKSNANLIFNAKIKINLLHFFTQHYQNITYLSILLIIVGGPWTWLDILIIWTVESTLTWTRQYTSGGADITSWTDITLTCMSSTLKRDHLTRITFLWLSSTCNKSASQLNNYPSKHLYNIYTMSSQRLRRWSNIV